MLQIYSKLARRFRTFLSVTGFGLLFMFFLPAQARAASAAVHMHETEAEGGFEITVRVVSEQTGEPLVGAVVRCKGAVSPAITDAQGRCVCRFDRTMDKVKVDVSYIGYKGVSKIVSVSSDRTIVVQLKDDSRQLDNVVVTAQKRHTNALQQSSAISSETLERGGATSLAKLLETVPGVSSVSTGSSSMVEVVKGAECIRYGFGAMGGVVLLNDAALPYGQTKPVPSGNVNIGYDTNARGFSGSGSIESGYKNFGLRVHGMYTRGGDYRTADYVLNNTGYNTISLSAQAGYRGRKFTATFFTSIYYQRSGIYYASKISDLSQLIKRFEYGRPSPETIFPFSYRIKPPFQQSQHVTMKGELKWDINPNHRIDFTLSFQENLRQEFENRKKTQWSWIPVQDLILKTTKLDVLWHARWKLWHMTTDAGTSNTYQTNYNYPGTKQPAFVPNFAALSMGGYFLHKAQFNKLQCALGMRYDFRVMSVNGYSSLSNYTYYDDFKLYSNFTMSLAGHYQFNDNWDARANIGWSWRPPDINELYSIGLQDGSYWVVGNRNLASERGYKLVAGARYRNAWLSVEPSAFYQRVNSYIYDHIGEGKDRFHNHPSGKYPKFIYDQDDVKLYGGDIEVTARPIKRLTFVGKGEWIFARNITHNDWLPFMPSDRYGLSSTYDVPLPSNKKYRATISLSGIYVTKQNRFDPDKDLVSDSPPAYFLLNGTADFRIALGHRRELKFMLVGENILNNLYKEYTDRFRYYAHERGANFSLRTLYHF